MKKVHTYTPYCYVCHRCISSLYINNNILSKKVQLKKKFHKNISCFWIILILCSEKMTFSFDLLCFLCQFYKLFFLYRNCSELFILFLLENSQIFIKIFPFAHTIISRSLIIFLMLHFVFEMIKKNKI